MADPFVPLAVNPAEDIIGVDAAAAEYVKVPELFMLTIAGKNEPLSVAKVACCPLVTDGRIATGAPVNVKVAALLVPVIVGICNVTTFPLTT